MNRRQRIFDHVQATIGPVQGIFDCGAAYGIHLELLHVPPTEHKPFHVVASVGVSDRAMSVPAPERDEEPACPHVELLMGLGPDWPSGEDGRLLEAWPLEVINVIGRFPHQQGAWLAPGHTIPNGDPPQPFVPDGPAGVIALPPVALMPEVEWLEGDGEAPIRFMALVPLYADELSFKVQNGVDALLARLDRHDVNEIYAPGRPKVAGGLFDLI